MAGFDASGVVEPLDYTLKPFVDAEGTIPEPSPLQVEKYLDAGRKEMLRARREARELGITDDDMEPEALLEALSKIDPARTRAARKRNAQILSDLCSGQPTTEQLLALPHRILREFANWASGEVLSPEVSGGAGRPPLEIVRSSAAG